jgi:2-dehydro-3-deoxyphosphogluconate aldolase / (4S)-4-hydroxy-2-oxoglutarate aldolase
MKESPMHRDETLSFLLEHKVVAVIRMTDPDKLLRVVEAVAAGGVRAVEITMTVPGAVEIIRGLADRGLPGVRLGAGTVMDAETAVAVIEAGAEFVVSPIADSGMIRECRRCGVLVAPGAYTPAEIWRAWSEGADIVKVFPATALGPAYFKDLKGPFPDIRLMPTGGVTPGNARSFIDAGACCVGIGTALLDKTFIAEGRWDDLAARAAALTASLR